uniref:Uncharacterized protein n=1 Tax=Anguilla anguilla TaxID=7936 RepID=A0A0E9WJY4_ANGAN
MHGLVKILAFNLNPERGPLLMAHLAKQRELQMLNRFFKSQNGKRGGALLLSKNGSNAQFVVHHKG